MENEQEILKEFEEKWPHIKTELGEDRPLHKLSDIKDWLSQTLDIFEQEVREDERGKMKIAIKSMVVKQAAGSLGDKQFEIEMANRMLDDTIKPKLLNLFNQPNK